MKNNSQPSNKNKINIHEEYLQIYEKHVAKYGSKTLVLMQIGSFHECYSTEERGPNLFNISDLLNIVCTRKDKSINKIDEKNPFMLGFTSIALQKYLKILIDYQYTVVVIDQVSPPPCVKREITGIYSQSTYIDNISMENKYLMTIYIEINSAINSNKSNISIGMSTIDITTGHVYWYESHGSGILNENESWEEAQRFYHYFRPVELIVYQINNQNNQIKFNINEKIDIIPNQIILSYEKINPDFCKINYQTKLLKKVYPQCGMDTPIEFIGLEKYPYAIIALINSFDYIYRHNENLINELKAPQYFNEYKYMILGNNAQYQLNIIDYYNWDKIDSKFHSLNSVINNCATSMGKRMLKHRLCAPFTDIKTIQFYYNLTEIILNLKLWEPIRIYLKEISDLDKLIRKLSIKFIQPYELYLIYNSMINIVKIIELLSNSDFKNELYKIFSKKQIKQFINCLNQIETTFDIEILKISNLIEIKNSFYLKGIYPDLDDLHNNIENSIGMIEKLAKVLENICTDVSLSIKHNDRDGYYLFTTKIRGDKLEKELLKQKKNFKLGNKEINYNELNFKYQTNTCKISYLGLSDHSDEIEDLYDKLNLKIKEYFYQDTLKWYKENSNLLKDVVNLIVQLDLITNNAYTSVKYHYVKPLLNFHSEQPNSFIRAENLRHPIIERIIDYEYVPHDVKLDDEIRGNLIYGYNGAGKCFDPNTLIMMFDGSSKKASDIKMNDLLMGDDSSSRIVLGITKGKSEMYEIIPSVYDDFFNCDEYKNDNNFIVNGPHILCLKGIGIKKIIYNIIHQTYNICWYFNGKINIKIFDKTDINNINKFYNNLNIFDDIIEITVDEYLKTDKHWKLNYFLYKKEINFEEKITVIDPYIFGFLIGIQFNNKLLNHKLKIPNTYKYNSKTNRIKLLAGLIDSNINSENCFNLSFNNNIIIDDIIFIARSLGFSFNLNKFNKNFYKILLIPTQKLYYEISIFLKNIKLCKKIKIKEQKLIPFIIKSKGIGNYCGFETNKNKRFLLNNFIVTHNSSIMKAIGTSLIMAQCGMYVPADSFEYGVFDSLYTRISGNDNLFKGHSSFIIEMNELRTILKKATSKSLIIGDEICRGTEYLSANAIVASAILKLVSLDSKFLFATHLHELVEIDEIKILNKVKFFHLSVEKKGDELVFNRKMVDGTGEQIYGITVAQYILDDVAFINKAIDLKNILLEKTGTNTKLLSDKKSLYNKDLYMDTCAICGSDNKLESHHINMQKDFKLGINGEINEKKKHIVKNSKANLIILCSKCHDHLHSGNFTISGLIKSSNGIKII